MILESVIAKIVGQQKDRIASRDGGLKRELIPAMQSLSSHALIISGKALRQKYAHDADDERYGQQQSALSQL